MVPAAEVDPFHLGKQVAERFFHGGQGGSQGISVLLAEGVEVQAVQQGGEAGLLGHGGIPLGTGGA